MIERRRLFMALALTAIFPAAGAAQTDTVIAAATDLSVPAVPAFTLLDVNPATVARPGLVEDFNFDLVMKDGSLAPDLALEARPVWIFGFRGVDRAAYEDTPAPLRILSTLSVSLGTAAKDDGQRMAWAAKLSLVRPDPLLDSAYIADIGNALNVDPDERRLARAREDSLISARTASDTARVRRWYEGELEKIAGRVAGAQLQAVREAVADFRERSWNATAIDVAFGQLLDYTAATLDDLELSQAGLGGWVSAGTGFGTRRWLLTGLARVIDLDTDPDISLGANIRFGGASVNGFMEYVFAQPESEVTSHTIAYGGEFQFDESRVIAFGLRTALDEDLDLRSLRPVIKLRWEVAGQDFDHVFGR